jgi:hypothetical protein
MTHVSTRQEDTDDVPYFVVLDVVLLQIVSLLENFEQALPGFGLDHHA